MKTLINIILLILLRFSQYVKLNGNFINCYPIGYPLLYRGNVKVTTNGNLCDTWIKHYDIEKLKEWNDDGNHNFCRNFDLLKPFCFISNGSREICDVKPCVNLVPFIDDLSRYTYPNNIYSDISDADPTTCYKTIRNFIFEGKVGNNQKIEVVMIRLFRNVSNIMVSALTLNWNGSSIEKCKYTVSYLKGFYLFNCPDLNVLYVSIQHESVQVCELAIFIEGKNCSERGDFIDYTGDVTLPNCISWSNVSVKKFRLFIPEGIISENKSFRFDFDYCRLVRSITVNVNEPVCFTSTIKFSPCKVPICKEKSKSFKTCYGRSINLYSGNVNQYDREKKCMNWMKVISLKLEKYGDLKAYSDELDEDLDHNNCRNYGRNRPWCYSLRHTVELCPVPSCVNIGQLSINYTKYMNLFDRNFDTSYKVVDKLELQWHQPYFVESIAIYTFLKVNVDLQIVLKDTNKQIFQTKAVFNGRLYSIPIYLYVLNLEILYPSIELSEIGIYVKSVNERCHLDNSRYFYVGSQSINRYGEQCVYWSDAIKQFPTPLIIYFPFGVIKSNNNTLNEEDIFKTFLVNYCQSIYRIDGNIVFNSYHNPMCFDRNLILQPCFDRSKCFKAPLTQCYIRNYGGYRGQTSVSDFGPCWHWGHFDLKLTEDIRLYDDNVHHNYCRIVAQFRYPVCFFNSNKMVQCSSILPCRYFSLDTVIVLQNTPNEIERTVDMLFRKSKPFSLAFCTVVLPKLFTNIAFVILQTANISPIYAIVLSQLSEFYGYIVSVYIELSIDGVVNKIVCESLHFNLNTAQNVKGLINSYYFCDGEANRIIISTTNRLSIYSISLFKKNEDLTNNIYCYTAHNCVRPSTDYYSKRHDDACKFDYKSRGMAVILNMDHNFFLNEVAHIQNDSARVIGLKNHIGDTQTSLFYYPWLSQIFKEWQPFTYFQYDDFILRYSVFEICTIIHKNPRRYIWIMDYCEHIRELFLCQFSFDIEEPRNFHLPSPFFGCLSPIFKLFQGPGLATISGKPCQPWIHPINLHKDMHNIPYDLYEHSFCRQDYSSIPWCFVDIVNDIREFCFFRTCVNSALSIINKLENILMIDNNWSTCDIRRQIYAFWSHEIKFRGFSLVFNSSLNYNGSIKIITDTIQHEFLKYTLLDKEIHVGYRVNLKTVMIIFDSFLQICELYLYVGGLTNYDELPQKNFFYVGYNDRTESGSYCMQWNQLPNYKTLIFPEGSPNILPTMFMKYVISNKCRSTFQIVNGIISNMSYYCYTKNRITEKCGFKDYFHESCYMPVDTMPFFKYYNGPIATTYKNMTCLPWSKRRLYTELADELNSAFVSVGLNLNNNYCRNIFGQTRTWCYYMLNKWEFCNVELCVNIGFYILIKPHFLVDGLLNYCNAVTYETIEFNGLYPLVGLVFHFYLNKIDVGIQLNLLLTTTQSQNESISIFTYRKYYYLSLVNITITAFTVTTVTKLCEIEIFSYKSITTNKVLHKYMTLSDINRLLVTDDYCDSWHTLSNKFNSDNQLYRVADISLVHNQTESYLHLIGHLCRNLYDVKTRNVFGLDCVSPSITEVRKCKNEPTPDKLTLIEDKCIPIPGNTIHWDYNGRINITRDGIPCQYWNVDYPHKRDDYIIKEVEKLNITHNHCRQFNGSSANVPWCYTISSEVKWELCQVPFCVDIRPAGNLTINDVNIKIPTYIEGNHDIIWQPNISSVYLIGGYLATVNNFGLFFIIKIHFNNRSSIVAYVRNVQEFHFFSINQRINYLTIHFENYLAHYHPYFLELKLYVYGKEVMGECQFPNYIDYIGKLSKTMRNTRCLDWINWYLQTTHFPTIILPEGNLMDLAQNKYNHYIQNYCRNPYFNGKYFNRTICMISLNTHQVCRGSKDFHSDIYPKTRYIYNRQTIFCHSSTYIKEFETTISFYSSKNSYFYFSVNSNQYIIPDDIAIGHYKVVCLVKTGSLDFVTDHFYTILVIPNKLYVGPSEVKLFEPISCYPYANILPKNFSEVNVNVNWNITFKDGVSEYDNFTVFISDGYVARIKEEGAFGIYQGLCSVSLRVFTMQYNLQATFTFKVKGFSKISIIAVEHKVPMFFFIYVTCILYVANYLFCFIFAYEKTQQKVKDIEVRAIMATIRLGKTDKYKWTHQTYYLNKGILHKNTYKEIVNIIRNKKLEFRQEVEDAMVFDPKFLSGLTISEPITLQLKRSMKKESLIPNSNYFVKRLSRGSCEFPNKPTRENMYTILAQKVMNDSTFEITYVSEKNFAQTAIRAKSIGGGSVRFFLSKHKEYSKEINTRVSIAKVQKSDYKMAPRKVEFKKPIKYIAPLRGKLTEVCETSVKYEN